ncbi:MAG: hypothetical protein ABSA93_29600 [Streptosporangiaceae bacterium]|jgi:hypothetical protein
MPNPWHDAVTHLIEHDPDIAVTIARDYLGTSIAPDAQARLAPSKFNDRPSTDFDCDSVVIVGPRRDPVRGIIVEAQQSRNEEKRLKFAKYAAELWILLGCPVDVIVICPDEATCNFYAEPFLTSLPGYVHIPRPLHPSVVPVITDAEQMAKDPARADLVLAFHGDKPGVVEAFTEGMRMLGAVGRDYYEFGTSLVTDRLKRRLEELVAGTFIASEWGKKAYADGQAKGVAMGEADRARQDVLRVLKIRGLEITDEQRTLILSCDDLELLGIWHDRAVTAERADEVFELRVFVAFGAALDEVDGVECGLVDEALAFRGG